MRYLVFTLFVSFCMTGVALADNGNWIDIYDFSQDLMEKDYNKVQNVDKCSYRLKLEGDYQIVTNHDETYSTVYIPLPTTELFESDLLIGQGIEGYLREQKILKSGILSNRFVSKMNSVAGLGGMAANGPFYPYLDANWYDPNTLELISETDRIDAEITIRFIRTTIRGEDIYGLNFIFTFQHQRIGGDRFTTTQMSSISDKFTLQRRCPSSRLKTTLATED